MIASEIQPPFWLVWRRGGRAPCYEHESYIGARTEAERLAKANPGQRFYVLSPVARGIQDGDAVWSHYAPIGIDWIDEDAEDAPKELA